MSVNGCRKNIFSHYTEGPTFHFSLFQQVNEPGNHVRSNSDVLDDDLLPVKRRLGLPVEFETATDPFFNPSQNPKYLMQRLDPVKHEMIFDGHLAIGSVNFHRNYFGEAFGIERAGEQAFSGCVAFGLERWIFAILSHFGPNPAAWPNLSIDGASL